MPVLALCVLLAHPVVIEPSGNTVRVTIGGELFAALQTDEQWPKPFLYPVCRPGWSTTPRKAGYAVTVVRTSLRNEAGETLESELPAGTKLAAGAPNAQGLVRVLDATGPAFVAVDDVVPVEALAVRPLESQPMPYVRRNPGYVDHPHHKGVWISVDEVNGVSYWNEDGTIRVTSVDVLPNEDGAGLIRMVTDWRPKTPDKPASPVLSQTTEYRFHADHFIDFRTTFRPAADIPVVTFGDTKEGLLGLRVPADMRARSGGGEISSSEGTVGEEATWGREADWVRYSGTVAGGPLAITLFDHPGSVRKSRYHVRNYGLFAINPFGPHAYSNGRLPKSPVVLTSGQSETADEITVRHGLWFHSGESPQKIDQRHARFISE